MASKTKSNEKTWFKHIPFAWWHPVSFEGWLVSMLYVTFLAFAFLKIASNSMSSRETLFGFAPHFVIASLLYLLICYHTAEWPARKKKARKSRR
ncbi:MAG TPA: hypothetical protein VEA59_04210 [Patescibacteria group bacterium]|nr:hypothetical protein [Patescibacteria group bacterium]